MQALLRILAIGVLVAFGPATAMAEPVSLTTLDTQSDIDDPKNAVAVLLKSTWADGLAANAGRAYGFAYAIVEVGSGRYLLSSLRTGDCRPNECDWKVQKLTDDYRATGPTAAFAACGELNKADLTADRLTLCGQEVALP